MVPHIPRYPQNIFYYFLTTSACCTNLSTLLNDTGWSETSSIIKQTIILGCLRSWWDPWIILTYFNTSSNICRMIYNDWIMFPQTENTTKLFCGPNTAGAPQNNFYLFVAQSDPEGQQAVIKYCNKRHLLFMTSNNQAFMMNQNC